jgi:4-hydroxy-3-methylbut-2-enyl diphosphate reductase
MQVKLAKKVGFCFGVKRAIEMAEDVLSDEKRAYSLGSIIHNKQVVDALAKRGLKVIDDINKARSGCLVVSSHGISPKKCEEIKKRSLKLVDTTCPFVRNAQEMAARLSREGCKVMIVGDANHPEVKALVDFAGKGACVVKDASGVKALKIKKHDKVGILSQTTQAMDNFLPVIKAVIEASPASLRVINTICKDAEERQASAAALARQVNLMLVVGGKSSANTRRLFEVCKSIIDGSYLVETEKDIKGVWFNGVGSVGVTSGASTPDWVVEKVVKRVDTKVKSMRKEGSKQ